MNIEKVIELIKTYESYLRLLKKSDGDAISIAYVHGWRCDEGDFEKGKIFRTKIRKLKKTILEEYRDFIDIVD